MEEFYQRYLRVCKESRVTPLECVTSQLQVLQRSDDLNQRRLLDLSSYNLTPEDCNTLAKVLSYDNYFTEVSFNDCLLSEDASKILLYGLARTRVLEIIDLKGNNLRCSGAEVVGLFLKKNTSVRCLRLDWNSLGLWGTGIAALADGLAFNQTLVLLDLRNNQITHEGASELATCLKRNKTLKGLDLRWNNIGLLGGRAFLSTLQHNKSITSLELQGNNVPQDILKAISVAVKVNNDQEAARDQENARTEKIMKKMERIELEKTMQVSMLQEKLEEQTNTNDELTKSSHNKIFQLKEALGENKKSFNKLSEELLSTKNDLRSKEEESTALIDAFGNLKNELSTVKGSNKALESQLQASEGNRANLEQKIAELKKKEGELENTVRGLETGLDKMKTTHHIEQKHLEEKHEGILKKIQEGHNSEREYMQTSFKEKESIMKNKLEGVEKEKLILEEKASELRSEIVEVKLKAKEEAVNFKAQLKHEHLLSSKQYEEKIEALQSAKDDQQSQVTRSLNQISELQLQLNLKTQECDQNKNERENLTQQLLRKENEYATELSRLKMEVESERRTQDELRNKISSLETNIKDNARRHKELIATKDQEIANLEDKLQCREVDLRKQREEEVRRAELLESAVFTYITSTRASRASSPCK